VWFERASEKRKQREREREGDGVQTVLDLSAVGGIKGILRGPKALKLLAFDERARNTA